MERERDGGLCYWNFEEGEIIGMGRSGLLESEEEERRELFFFYLSRIVKENG